MAGRWKGWNRDKQREAELAAEIENHIRERAAQYEAQGASGAEALRRARMQFGSVQAAKEEVRTVWPWELLRAWLRDLSYAVRTLARDRAFTIAVVASLAIGLGASTAMYSVLYGVLLQPLPFPHADRIYRIYEAEVESEQPSEVMAIYWGSLRELQENAQSMEAITAVLPSMHRLETGDTWPRRVPGAEIDRYFFQVFPAQPAIGRFPSAESWDNTDRDTAVLSFEIWMSDYGGDPSVVGKTMRLTGTSSKVDRELKIIGVLPADFQFPTWRLKAVRYLATSAEDWRTLSPDDGPIGWRHQDTFVRAADGASRTALRGELGAIYRGLQEKDPGMPKRALAVVPMASAYAEKDRTPLQLLFGAALALTLLCCLNVANLMVARGLKTAPEIGIRKALGGGRTALLRGIASQALVLGVAGTAGAAAIAVAVSHTLRLSLPAQVPYGERIGFPVEVLAFLAGCAVATILLASSFLGWYTLRAPTLSQLSKSIGRHTGTVGSRTRQSLLVAQVGASLILLCGASLLLTNLNRTVSQDFGFAWKGIAAVNLFLTSRDMEKESLVAMVSELSFQMSNALIGTTWALSDNPPLGMAYAANVVHRQDGSRAALRDVAQRSVGPEYFQFLGIPLLQGRGFTRDDQAGADPVAVVSRQWARWMLDTDEPVGLRFRTSTRPEEPWITVVGVVSDVRVHTNFRAEVPCMYRPLAQVNPPFLTILLKTAAPAEQIETAARAAIEQAWMPKPELRIGRVADAVWFELEQSRFYSLALGAFAAVALVLAAIGVYGVLQYQAVRRQREFGVRAAMGANGRNLKALVLRQAATPMVVGGAVGLAAAMWASRFLESLLHTIQPLDPQPYVVAAVVLLAAAILAGWIPARQASRSNPADCLRAE